MASKYTARNKKKTQSRTSVRALSKAKPIAPPPPVACVWKINEKRWTCIFVALAGVVLLAMLFVATQSGVTGDEFIDSHHGKYSLKYYAEGDTTFMDYSNVMEVYGVYFQKYFGSGYEIIPAIVVKYFGLSQHEYLIRHLLCAFLGFLFMLFAALTARTLKNSLLACITLLIMALTPTVFGLSMFATKDLPMAAGFSIAIFAFVRIFKRLPCLKWQDLALAIAGIALATSVRIGGLMLIGYLGVGALFALIANRQLRASLLSKPYAPLCKVIFMLGGVALIGPLLGLCLYPNFFKEGFMHIQKAFSVVSNHPMRITMLWDGKLINSLELPDGYLLKSFFFTVPIFASAAFCLFFCNVRSVWKTMDKASVLLLLFTVLFPFTYISYGSHVYNGWRHLTFTYSSFAILVAVGVYQTLFWVKSKAYAPVWRYAVSGVLAVSMGAVLVWMAKNHRYTYAYYNAFVPEPYMKYDLDYYETTNTVALDWLVANELKERKDTVLVGVKNRNAIYYAQSRGYENVKMSQISYRNFAEEDIEYAILSIQFIPSNVLKTSFPPKGVIHTETINGKPICVVVKKDNRDARGVQAVRRNRVEEGMKLLEEAYEYDPRNFGIWFWMGYGYFQQQKYSECIRFFTAYVNFWPASSEQIGLARMHIGASQVNLQKPDAGIQTLKEAATLVKEETNKKFIETHLGMAYFDKQSYAQAITHLKNAVDYYPHLNALIAQAYARMQ
jgi:tetratricopeptide (TPR) repeat protein